MEEVVDLPADPADRDKENRVDSASSKEDHAGVFGGEALEEETVLGVKPPPPRFLFKPSCDQVRISALDADPLLLDARRKMETLALASCDDGVNDADENCADDDYPSVFETPIDLSQRSASRLPVGATAAAVQSTFASPFLADGGAASRRLPLRPKLNIGNIDAGASATGASAAGESTDSSSSFLSEGIGGAADRRRNICSVRAEHRILNIDAGASAAGATAAGESGGSSSKLPAGIGGGKLRHVLRLPFGAEDENAALTPFSDKRRPKGSSIDPIVAVPSLTMADGDAGDADRSIFSNIELQMLEHQEEDREEQRYESALRLKDIVAKYELLQNERLLLIQKHEMESASNRQNFESQLGAKTSVINTLQDALKEQYGQIEKLQNDLIAAQSKIDQPRNDQPETPTTPKSAIEGPSTVSKLVSALRQERRSLHEEKIKLTTALESSKAENTSMRHRLDSLTTQMTSPKHPKTPDLEKKLLAEANRQARDLRARERLYNKEIQSLKNDVETLKEERRAAEASKVERESELSITRDRLATSEEEKKKLKDNVLTLEVELEMKNKTVSKLNKQQRTEMSDLLGKNLHLAKQLRDSEAEMSTTKTRLSQLEAKCEKFDSQHRHERSIEKPPREADSSEAAASSEPQSAAECLLANQLQKMAIAKEVAESALETSRTKTKGLESQLRETTQLYDAACKENDRFRLRINELEAELESQRSELAICLVHKSDAVADAVSRTKAESESEIARLKDVVGKLVLVRSQVKAMQDQYRDFKKEADRLPRWYSRMFSNFSAPILEKISQANGEHCELSRRYLHEMATRKELHNQLITLQGNIRVFCRVRPTLSDASVAQVVEFDRLDDGVVLLNHKGNSLPFAFDRVFRPSTTQEDVFAEVCPLITSVVDGYNLCILAYGQTGSGKTYTMEGPADSPGINQRALARLFEIFEERAPAGWDFAITVSILEIYNENLYDLLSSSPHEKLETSKGSPAEPVCEAASSAEEINWLLHRGGQNRAVAATKLNSQSSRSHAIVCVRVTGLNRITGRRSDAKLNLCDLAGSENVGLSEVVGARLEEAKNINKSLSALGLVIHGLQSKNSHIPYRNSKLTTLLQPSLTGDSKVLMVVQVAPEESHLSTTKESMRFGARASKVEINSSNNNNNNNRNRANAVPAGRRRSQSVNAARSREQKKTGWRS